VPPTLIELDSFDELKKEVFGPVLHVVRYNRNDVVPFAGVFAILAHRLIDGAAFGAHRLNMAFDILSTGPSCRRRLSNSTALTS
jgi:hypothetical protein